jgi:hypothetical protein
VEGFDIVLFTCTRFESESESEVALVLGLHENDDGDSVISMALVLGAIENHGLFKRGNRAIPCVCQVTFAFISLL